MGIGQGYVQTFDKKSYSYNVDECDHMITSDCSKDLSHAVLAKEVNGMKHVPLFHEQSKIELRPAQAYSNYVDEYKLTVNGQKVELQKGEKITLQSSQEQVTVYWSNDNTVVINTPNTRLVHSGKTVTVEEKSSPDGSHCGLCGDYNLDKRADVKSSKGCVFSSYWLAAQSYRSKSSQCTPLSSETLNKICFSQDPVIKCSVNTVPKELRKKTVNFVCLPEGRIAKMYIEKVEHGERLQELKRQEVDFQVEMDQPISCHSFKF